LDFIDRIDIAYSGAAVRARANVFIICLVVSTIISLVHGVWAQTAGGLEKPIGKIMTATGDVSVEHTAAVVVQASVASVVQAKEGDVVYRGDVIQTGRNGKLDLTFADGTTFNISSNARMVLDEFVYDPNGRANSTFFSLTKGTFNFVAGKVAQTGNMKIDTPVGTMGIRGTAPRVEISENGAVTFSTLIEADTTRGARPRQ
jgi:hypothetical protein